MTKRRFGRNVPPHARPPVAWYQIDVLWTAARDVISSLDQLRNRDLRESYELPLTVIDRSSLDENGEFWFDFIADTGDGGNATYAVASLALKDQLILSMPHNVRARLMRGELLLLGGDLAYPGASSAEYRYRFVEMFEAVRNSADPTYVRSRPLTLAALAQNHDWMDSASTFSRYFLRGSDSAPLLGAEIPQRQSYFCAKLPQGWWALGLDFALQGDIDRDQFEQFEALLSAEGLTQEVNGSTITYHIGPQDSVLLVYPEPYWTRAIFDGADPGHPKRYQRLEGLLGQRIRLRLAGDLHHYMRWKNDVHGLLVTCGTGGAFTHPTHTLSTTERIGFARFDANIRIPPEPDSPDAVAIGRTSDKEAYPDEFDRQEHTVYPNRATSRAQAVRNPLSLLGRQHGAWGGGNQTFALLMGLLYWLNAYVTATPFHDSFKPDGFSSMWRMAPENFGLGLLALWVKAMIFSPLGMIINSLMLAGCVIMGREAATELAPGSGRIKRWIWTTLMGMLHGIAHAIAVFSLQFWLQIGATSILHLDRDGLEQMQPLLLHSLMVGTGMLVGGSIIGALLFGCYLTLMSTAGLLTNNGFSALGIQDFKGFLRFRISADGNLAAYFIALDSVPRHWKGEQDQTAGPIWSPDKPLEPRLHDTFILSPSQTGPNAPNTPNTKSNPPMRAP